MQHAVSQLISKKWKLNFYRDRIGQLEEVLQGVDIAIAVFDP